MRIPKLEALRRIGRGCPHQGRSRTGDVAQAVRHARAVLGDIRRLQNMPEEELMTAAQELGHL
jgi:pyridoxal 5'-phosphate synthase pdxS subunit